LHNQKQLRKQEETSPSPEHKAVKEVQSFLNKKTNLGNPMYTECIKPTIDARRKLHARAAKPPKHKRIRKRPNLDQKKMFGGTTPMHFMDDESASTFSQFTDIEMSSAYSARVKDKVKSTIG
jgi:hypothetical protein